MNSIIFALLCGIIFSFLDVLLTLPIRGSDRWRQTMLGTLSGRVLLAFLIASLNFRLPLILAAISLGCFINLLVALFTRTLLPTVAIGIIGGIAVGVLAEIIY